MDGFANLPQSDEDRRWRLTPGRRALASTHQGPETDTSRTVARQGQHRRGLSGRRLGPDGGSTAQQPISRAWWRRILVSTAPLFADSARSDRDSPSFDRDSSDRNRSDSSSSLDFGSDGSLGSFGSYDNLDCLSSVDSVDSLDSLDSLDSDADHTHNTAIAHPHHPAHMATWSGQPSVRGATETAQMMLLTCSSLGVAFTWGVEMTYGTPYLLSLGLTKGQASFVWLAGPLSGLIVQPVIGVVSDSSTLKWGRRRPFIIVGSILVACGLLTLGFTREIVGFLFGSSPATPLLDAAALPPTATHTGHRKLIIALAVLALYLTDFAINAVMSCARSLLVDTLPLTKQQDGAAWASRMASFGHLVGYAAGAVDLVQIFGPVLGDTQFKKLSAVAAISILTTSSITCWAVSERVLLRSSIDEHADRHGARSGGPGSWLAALAKIFRQIWSTLMTLPPRIQAICWAVFWGWIAWFPFIVYSSTWVGETYFRYDVHADAHSTGDAVGDMGRIGSYALTSYSCATVLAATILPLLVRSPLTENYTRRPPASVARFAERFEKSRPDLLTAWTLAHIVFACCMVLAPFATSFRSATMIVTLCGLPYTLVSWAPTTFLGIEINRMTAHGGSGAPGNYSHLLDDKLPMSSLPVREATPLEHGRARHSSRHGYDSDDPHAPAAASGELSGIYFGILNIYMTVPQFIGNLISACVFAVLEPGKSPELAKDAHPSEHHSTDGPNAIGVTFFIGAIFALVSAYATRRVRRL